MKREATAPRVRPWLFEDVNASEGLDSDDSETLHLDGYLA